MLPTFDKFIERYPEFETLGSQNRKQVEANLREARSIYSDERMVYLKTAALLSESPVGRAAGLVLKGQTASTYTARLQEEQEILALGDRCH
jgi:hypothetical protein